MDVTKLRALKSELAKMPEPRITSIERFFDGNDDAECIGWNLPENPGLDAFRKLLTGLLRRPDVQAVYIQVEDLSMGEDDAWPDANVIFVVGTILPEELQKILHPLQPCEVCSLKLSVPEIIKRKHHAPVVAARWA